MKLTAVHSPKKNRKTEISILFVFSAMLILPSSSSDGAEPSPNLKLEVGSFNGIKKAVSLIYSDFPQNTLVTTEVSAGDSNWTNRNHFLSESTRNRTVEVPLRADVEFFRASARAPTAKFRNGDFDFATSTFGFIDSVSKITRPYQSNSSPSGNWTIYSYPERFESPDLYILDHIKETVRRLTNNKWIEFSPVVNDSGNYGYSLFSYSSGSSEIYLDGNILEDPLMDGSVPFYPLAISEKFLCFASNRPWDNRQFIYTYELGTKTMSKKPLPPMVVQMMDFVLPGTLLVEVFNLSTPSSDVYLFDCASQELQAVAADSDVSELVWDVSEEGFEIITQAGDINGLLVHNFLLTWIRTQIGSPFSYGSNELGRLSWNQSYLLEALIDLGRKTQHPSFIAAINRMAKDLLDIRNKFNPDFAGIHPNELWSTTKYSIDQSTPLNLLVDDAKIIYPLLLASNNGFLDPILAEQVTKIAEAAFVEFERDYIPSQRQYRAQKGINYKLDGIWLPNNMQNAFGLCLIELYKATGNIFYSTRVTELAKRFREEWEELDSAVLWHYWPKIFYDGWTVEDDISTNSPTRKASDDSLFEDVSHAGINVKFIHEFRAAFGAEIFTDNDYNQLKKQLSNIVRSNSFTRFISGDTQHSLPNFRYMPRYGWGNLQAPDLLTIYSRYIPLFAPDFDNLPALNAYAQSLPEIMPNFSITIETVRYSPSGNEIRRKTSTIDSLEKLFKRFRFTQDTFSDNAQGE